MGMVAIIEQLGKAYKRKDLPVYPDKDASAFKKSLYYFNNQRPNDDITKALYGLRNGIVHNASVYSSGKFGPPHYIFTYAHDTLNVISPATIAWDGNFKNITIDFFTTVNPSKLFDTAQNCMNNVAAACKAGNLDIVLPTGRNEFIFRYFKLKPLV